jgi:SAM-dependent methyltransferase
MSGVGSTDPSRSGGADFSGAGSGITDWFAGRVAERYDESTADMPVEPVVDFLAKLAGDGAALELAVGTGRIALPLAARGVPVAGIDLSPDMVAQLRAKPGGEAMPIEIGDYASTRVEGEFALVYIVFNSINNQTTQEAQIASFENAAAHLRAGGCFVVEVGVPARERLSVFDLSDTHVGVDEYDSATQRLVSHHFTLVDGRWERLSMPFRSVSPPELDLMARLAGMRLRERWSGWRREPFTSESTMHVSVWEKPV